MTAFPNNSKCAFSLVEVVLALFVVAIGLVALFGLLADGVSMGNKATQESRISLVAGSILNDWTDYLHDEWDGQLDYVYMDPNGLYENEIGTTNPVYVIDGETGESNTFARARMSYDDLGPKVSKNDVLLLKLRMYPGPYGTNKYYDFFTIICNYEK